MAYLRGNSYVDGDLIVEGALQVKRLDIEDVSGYALPYLESTATTKNKYLVEFSSNDGGLTSSPFSITSDVNTTTLNLDSSSFLLKLRKSSNTYYSAALQITYNKDIPTIYFGCNEKSTASENPVLAKNIYVWDDGLYFHRDASGDYWNYSSDNGDQSPWATKAHAE